MLTVRIGPNTDAPRALLSDDYILLAGEEPCMADGYLTRIFGHSLAEHSFRGYSFQKRPRLTTLFSGMGTGCIEPLIWELAHAQPIRRIILVGTAGTMPACRLPPGTPYAIAAARGVGTGLQAIGLAQSFVPRWHFPANIPTASTVSTEFYYGFSRTVLDPSHPMHRTDLPRLFAESREDLVDMEVASFYAFCQMLLPPDSHYLAIKSPANPAGVGAEHLENTPSALESSLELAAKLLRD